MKFKATRKDFEHQRVISVGYCHLQHLLSHESPIAYNAGVYGWNWDVYYINNVYICTGYRNLTGIRPDYDTVKKFEDQARKISYSNLPYQEKEKELNKLQREFIKEVITK